MRVWEEVIQDRLGCLYLLVIDKRCVEWVATSAEEKPCWIDGEHPQNLRKTGPRTGAVSHTANYTGTFFKTLFCTMRPIPAVPAHISLAIVCRRYLFVPRGHALCYLLMYHFTSMIGWNTIE